MKKFSQIKYLAPLFIAVVFVLGMLSGMWIDRGRYALTPGQKKLNELLTIIDELYVDTVNVDSVIEKSLPGLLGTLDPHSVYIAAADREEVNSELEGSFGGIGIQFQVNNDTVVVVEVIANGPSEKAGVMAGDRIIEIDGKPFRVKDADTEVQKKLRGPKGSKVEITVLRQHTRKPLKFSITRGDIPLNSVDASYMADEQTGYVKVSRFARNTYREFLTALTDLHHAGAKDYIIDLRGNTGGFMETAILMVNEFLPERQTIVATHGRFAENDEIVMSDGTGAFQDARVIVLIDEMSASSSEIFSGALQDNDRGLIMGRRSFGKGLVQQQIDMEDGSQVRLTVQRYHTPSGRCIQKQYKPGDNDSYEYEIFERYRNGETLNADSVKMNKDLIFTTANGRTVYGGGGIMPDVFVPNDTTGITGYYINVTNAGLQSKFSYEYADLNRSQLNKAGDVQSLLKMLPSDGVLLSSFANYAASNGVPTRWYYLNISSKLIVTQLKALIARNILGMPAYYEVMNSIDNNVQTALKSLRDGQADFPIQSNQPTDKPAKGKSAKSKK